MKKYILSILTITLSVSYCNEFSFKNLLKNAKIQLEATALGGHEGEVLKLKIKNNTNKSIKDTLDAGLIFVNEDNKAQSLMAMDNYGFSLQPYSYVYINVYSNCIIPSNYSPYKDSKFKLDTSKQESLSAYAKAVARYRFYNHHTQGITWAIVRNDAVVCSSSDSVKFWPVYKVINNYVPVKVFKPIVYNNPELPQPVFVSKYAFSSRVNITANIQNQGAYTLICTDTTGKELRSYYKDKIIKNGIYSVTIGFNEIVEDTNLKVVFKFLDASHRPVFTKTVKNKHFDEKPQIWLYKTIFEYELLSDLTNANMQVIAPDGSIFETLYSGRKLPKGPRRTPYSFYHFYNKDAQFKIRINEGIQKVLEFDIKPITLDEIKN